MPLRLEDLDVVDDSYDNDVPAFTVYIKATGQGIGRLVYEEHTWHARDMAGMNKRAGFATPSHGALYLAALAEGRVI